MKSIGESWEISGVKGNESVVAGGADDGMTLPELIERDREALVGKANFDRFGMEFPLLIKFIDARQDLSIQVHPDDELAWERHQSKGKTEMWYVVDADNGSSLRSGFAKQVTPDEYEQSIADNTITDLLKEYEIHKGDLFFLPAGRIHSIGAGAFIAEIQQTSNITYRIYDFNRLDDKGNPRELHTELSKDAIDYTVLPDYRTYYEERNDERVPLVSCNYFTTSLLKLTKPYEMPLENLDSFVILICTSGKGTVTDNEGNSVEIRQGESVLVPASVKGLKFDTAEGLDMLTSWIAE
jgi:mannose-6-phosphate isomerase